MQARLYRQTTRLGTCPECRAINGALGVLGNRTHYRCRDCGAEYSARVEPYEPEFDRDDEPSDWTNERD